MATHTPRRRVPEKRDDRRERLGLRVAPGARTAVLREGDAATDELVDQ